MVGSVPFPHTPSLCVFSSSGWTAVIAPIMTFAGVVKLVHIKGAPYNHAKAAGIFHVHGYAVMLLPTLLMPRSFTWRMCSHMNFAQCCRLKTALNCENMIHHAYLKFPAFSRTLWALFWKRERMSFTPRNFF